MTTSSVWGVYVHVPWCRRRCPYCAFYVEVDRDADQPAFVERIIREYRDRSAAFEPLGPSSTVFFGGGTPSRLEPGRVADVIRAVQPGEGAEVTLEANPEDLDPARLDAFRRAGVTRLSVGLQTFDERFARLLNRNSSVRDAYVALDAVKEASFASYSVDLIFALPGQTIADVDAELDALMRVDPPHVSLYGLTFEPGTPFERARSRGKLVETDEETWRHMYDRITQRLTDGGWVRYEISNFAKPGHQSEHNKLYWTDRPYMGIGPSAHGYGPDGSRWHNVANLSSYLALNDPTAELEHPSALEGGVDLLLSSLRSMEGVAWGDLERHGVYLIPEDLRPLEQGGLLLSDPKGLRLTDSGVAVSDAVIARICDALRASPAMR